MYFSSDYCASIYFDANYFDLTEGALVKVTPVSQVYFTLYVDHLVSFDLYINDRVEFTVY